MPQNELKKASSEKDKLKIIVVAVVVTLCVVITLYFHIIGVEVVYTHLFYIPIGLASFWFGKKGFFVALILALVLLLTHLTVDQLFLNNVMRAFMFCIVGLAVGILSEERNKAENELKDYSERLEEKVEDMTRESGESEEKSRGLFEGVPACCWGFDRKGTILHWNKACEELYGWTAEQAIGKTMYDLMVKEENVAPTQEKIAAVFQGQSFQGVEYEDLRADGTTCNVLVNEYPLKDTSGKVIMGICAELDIIERKRAEEELRESEENFKRLFNKNPEALLYVDKNFKTIDINPQFEELFGYSIDEIKGKEIDEFIVPKDRMNEGQKRNEMSKKGYNFYETVRKKKDGTLVPVSLSAGPIISEGSIVGINVTYKDITERKRAEEELQESKNKIEQLHKVATQMEAVQSEEEVYQLTVDTAEKILQFNICLIYMTKGNGLVVKATSSDMPLAGGQDMSIDDGIAGKTYRTSESYLTEDIKEEKEARPSIDEYRSGISIPIGKFGVFQAISTKVGAFDQEDLKMAELLISHTIEALKRIRSEKALQESEEKYRSLTNQLPVGVYRTTKEGKFLHANPALATVLEFESVEDLMKVSESDVYNDPRERINQIKQWKTTKEIISNELKFRTKKGREIWIRDTGHAILDENGEISYIDGIIEDITDRKKAEELLKNQREELSVFAHTVSHDLKNYIGIIRNSAQFSLLKKEYAEKNNQRIIDMTKKMKDFVNRQLELADAGKAIGELEEIDLNKMIDEVEKAHSIEIHREELSMIKGDPQKLKEAFHNLIHNAIKHGKADRIEISSKKKKDSCIICVKDNGKGISEEDIDKIFDMGYSKTGTGFGLTIVKKIIEAHDGSISVKSKEGKGTTFEIVLPSRE